MQKDKVEIVLKQTACNIFNLRNAGRCLRVSKKSTSCFRNKNRSIRGL